MTIGSPYYHKAYGEGEVISLTEEFIVVRFDQPAGMLPAKPGVARVVPVVRFARVANA